MLAKRSIAYNCKDFIRPVKLPKVEEEVVAVSIEYPACNVDGDKKLSKLPFAKNIAQCSTAFDDLITFCRKSEHDAFVVLREPSNRWVLLTGPPGVGKSTVAWRFALVQAQFNSVAWVDVNRACHFILKNGEIKPYWTLPDVNGLDTDVVIFDGATKNEESRRIIGPHIAFYKYAKVIVVGSDGGFLCGELGTEVIQHDMPAWTLTEYLDACSHDAFFQQVLPYLLPKGQPAPTTEAQRKELVRRKYVIAGQCARLMFSMHTEDVRRAIRTEVCGISNFEEFFNMRVDDLEPDYKDGLMAPDPRISDPEDARLVFVSEFAARCIAQCMPPAVGTLRYLVCAFGSQATRRQALKIAFLHAVRAKKLADRVKYVMEPTAPPTQAAPMSDEEMDDLLDAMEAPQESLSEASDTEEVAAAALEQQQGVSERTLAENWDPSFSAVGVAIPFHRDVLDQDQRVNMQVGTYMLPDTPNQGGYDAVQLCRRRDGDALYLRFVQVTVQHDHPIKLHYMHIFLMTFNARRASQNLPLVSWDYEVVVLLPLDEAVLATPPWNWKVSDDQHTGTRSSSSAQPKTTCTRRVAGYRIVN